MDSFERRVVLGYVANLIKVMKGSRAVQNALGAWAIEIGSDSILDLSDIMLFANDDDEVEELELPRQSSRKNWSFMKISGRHKQFLSDFSDIVRQELKKHVKAKPSDLECNLRMMGELMGLDDLSVQMLGLAVRYKKGDLTGEGTVSPLWDMLCNELKMSASLRVNPRLFSIMLDADRATVSRHLQHNGIMTSTGLFDVDGDGDISIPERILEVLCSQISSENELKSKLLGVPALYSLNWTDYEHLAGDREHILKLLHGALEARSTGINILLYGPPGTGKTEFAKTVAAKLSVPLYMIGETDVNGKEPDRDDRVGELRIAQRLLSGGGKPALVLFDEAEDMFGTRLESFFSFGASRFQKRRGSKVFVNRCLENSPIPIIWTTNELKGFDPAVLRRMTYALEFHVPPLHVRQRVLSRELGNQELELPTHQVEELAKRFSTAPSVVVSAVKAAKLIDGGADDIERGIKSITKAMKGGAVDSLPSQCPFDPSLTNCVTGGAQQLAELTSMFCNSGSDKALSLCLSGPPGTGKSAYARFLAEKLGMEVIEKRASDLLSKYVGESEKLIASAFGEARAAGAFLIFDEADSLLGNRRDATRSWEVTQVNEMLTWMESHPLPFVCTTNLTERLDDAVWRRFLFKLRFDYMRHEQAESAFERFFSCKPPSKLRTLTMLTPADFALVRRKASVTSRLGDVEALVGMLEQECAAKPQYSKPIGFIH